VDIQRECCLREFDIASIEPTHKAAAPLLSQLISDARVRRSAYLRLLGHRAHGRPGPQTSRLLRTVFTATPASAA